jgi:methyl-accepting chemotaxis protein
MKRYLILKLLAINLVVIGFVMILAWVAIDTLAAGYFVTLMEKYNISPKPAHAMFVDAIHRYLLWVSLAAVILSVILSYLMMRRVLAPLTQMNAITGEIAAGNFGRPLDGGAGLVAIEPRDEEFAVVHRLREPSKARAVSEEIGPHGEDNINRHGVVACSFEQ